MIKPRSHFSWIPSLIPQRTAAARNPFGAVTPPPISKNDDSMVESRSHLIQQDNTSAEKISLHSESQRFVQSVHDVETLDGLAGSPLYEIVFRGHQNDSPGSRINPPGNL